MNADEHGLEKAGVNHEGTKTVRNTFSLLCLRAFVVNFFSNLR
jgi:hypothetical protein